MTDILLENPLLLLFVVIAIGYPLGRITFRGSSLGVAAVLFAGLVVGAFDADLKLPTIIYQLGLVLFVYTVGLSNGRGFFSAFRRQGIRDSLVVVGVVSFAATLSAFAQVVLELKPTFAGGMFAGSLTNTPALAAELEYLKAYVTGGDLEARLTEPVVGYSVAYPFGVLGVIFAIAFAQKLWKIDYRKEAIRVEDLDDAPRELLNRTVNITNVAATGYTVRDLLTTHHWDVIFGRVAHAGRVTLTTGETRFEPGDQVSVVGSPAALDAVTSFLGETSNDHLELDRTELDFRRIFVSSPEVAGHRLRDLPLRQRFEAVVTRVRRGDVEFLPRGNTVLQAGDRVRVVAPTQSMQAVSRFFGDSYRAVSEIDIPTFSVGLALGLLVGTVPIPFPGGVDIKLGLAGGPLVVALILGALDRTGPLTWTLPYSANVTLRQFGLVLFLAGIGVGAGYTFISTVREGDGMRLLVAGAVITFSTAMLTLWLCYKVLKIPMGLVIGMVAGIHTQPAVLGFALEQSDDELPNVGYAAVFPIATIAKIVAAQILLALML